MNAISSRSIARWTVLATVVALTAACETNAQSRPVASRPAPTSVAPSPAAPSPAASIPGRLYYTGPYERLVQVTGSTVKTVLEKEAYAANVSPDGARLAFIDGTSIDSGNLVISDRDGRNRRTVFRGAESAGFEPAWSPDSKQLVIAKRLGDGKRTIGLLTIATGRFTAWARQPVGFHFLWTADGKRVAYTDGSRLVTADPDGRNARVVPVFGSDDSRLNPKGRRTSDPYSISANGGLVSVWLRTSGEDDSDIGRDLIADAIVDTRTGENVGVPVRGEIRAILLQPDGDILVRTRGKLTLFDPAWTVKAQVTEPAAVSDSKLLAYRPN